MSRTENSTEDNAVDTPGAGSSPEVEQSEAGGPSTMRRIGSWLRSKRGIVILLVVVLVAAVAGVVALVQSTGRAQADPVAVSVPVAVSGVTVPDDAAIGVVLTFGDGAAEGAEWNQAAQGAVVAQKRLALGGADIRLLVEDDLGTSRGSEAAVRSLAEQGVAGIVYASSGAHVEAGVAAATAAKIPVILPYAVVPSKSSGVWSLAPDDASTGAAVTEAIAEFDRPLLIDAGGGVPDGVTVADQARFGSGTDLDQFAADVARRAGADPLAGGAYAGGQDPAADPVPPVERPADAVIVSGRPGTQATIVHALQSRNVSVPIVLTSQAVSPAFATTLAGLGGSVSPNLRTVGGAWDDAEALRTTAQGRAMSAFLAAVRQFSADDSVTNLTDDAPFADSASAADVRSHDAVLAFAQAMSAAGGIDPSKMQRALGTSALGAKNAIAGPELDFARAQALTAPATVLYATAQQLGLRPSTAERAGGLVWITEPSRP